MKSTIEPLVVSLEGTLTAGDTFAELVVQSAKRCPLLLLLLPLCLWKGRAWFQTRVAATEMFTPSALSYRDDLRVFLQTERAKGREIVLATGGDPELAHAVARHLGVFDAVVASNPSAREGQAKLTAIREKFGSRFVYAGDSAADLPIWKAATAAVLVGTTPRVSQQVRLHTPVLMEFDRLRPGISVWLRQLRVHQWLKNLLIFVPILTAFELDDVAFLSAMKAFVSFCLAASATYIFNDLWDLASDRLHPRKRNRPLARGQVTIGSAVMVSICMLSSSLMLALNLGRGFLLLLASYVAGTTAYSWQLKRYVLLDVIMLSALYTVRIISGSVAVGVKPSVWLLAFSVLLFLSLALIKRCTELLTLARAGLGAPQGRDYRTEDLTVLWPMGVGSGLSAVVVFILFTTSPDTESRYATPELLWLVAVGLICWLGRMWIKTARGEMHDDPLVYALRDRGSRILIVAMLVTTVCARLIAMPVP